MLHGAWDEEQAAAQIVAEAIGATKIVRRDVSGAPPGAHHYDLKTGERVVALEVTTATDQAVVEFWAAVHEREWEDPSLTNSWGIVVEHLGGVSQLHKRIGEALRYLEAAGIDRVDGSPVPKAWSQEVRDGITALHAIGVRQAIATSVPEGTVPRIVVGSVGPGNWFLNNDLNEVVQLEIEPNIKKLRKADVGERHLFVWLDLFSDKAQASVHHILLTNLVPDEPLNMPRDLDVVWVAPTALVSGENVLLKATAGGWELSNK